MTGVTADFSCSGDPAPAAPVWSPAAVPTLAFGLAGAGCRVCGKNSHHPSLRGEQGSGVVDAWFQRIHELMQTFPRVTPAEDTRGTKMWFTATLHPTHDHLMTVARHLPSSVASSPPQAPPEGRRRQNSGIPLADMYVPRGGRRQGSTPRVVDSREGEDTASARAD